MRHGGALQLCPTARHARRPAPGAKRLKLGTLLRELHRAPGKERPEVRGSGLDRNIARRNERSKLCERVGATGTDDCEETEFEAELFQGGVKLGKHLGPTSVALAI